MVRFHLVCFPQFYDFCTGLKLNASHLTVGIGSNVHLKCNTDIYPISWHTIRENNASYTIIESSPLLSLANIRVTESGHYQCLVNISGELIASNWATIEVFGKVLFMENLMSNEIAMFIFRACGRARRHNSNFRFSSRDEV